MKISDLNRVFLGIVLGVVPCFALGSEERVDMEGATLRASGTTSFSGGYVADESSAATKMDVPITETPRSIRVVTELEMEERGVQVLEDALQYIPGVSSHTYGYDSRGDWSKIRGVSPQEFRDGLKSLFGFYNNTRVHPYTLERVEVVKGPASVLYGQGSLGGIVNTRSKRPQAVERHEVSFEYGSYDRRELGVDSTGKLDESGTLLYRMVGAYRESGTQVDHVEDDVRLLNPSFTWKPTESTSFTLIGNWQENDSGPSTQFLPLEGTLLPGRRIPTDTFIGEPGWDTYDTEQAALTGLFEHEINDTWKIQAKARYTDSAADYRAHWVAYQPRPLINDDGTVTRTIYVSDHTSEIHVGDMRLQGEFLSRGLEQKIAVGLDYQDATTDNDAWNGYAGGGDISLFDPQYGNLVEVQPVTDNPETDTKQLGLYVNDHITFREHWIFSIGGRFDDTESGGSEDDAFSLDLGAMYQFDNGISPYISYAESFEPIAGVDIDDNPFDPKEGIQYEAGVKFQPANSDALFTLAVFDITEENRPTSAPGGTGNIQKGEAGIEGVELGAQTSWNELYFNFGYSYTNAEITRSNDGDEGFKLSSVPDHQGFGWVSYRPEQGPLKGFRAGFGARYTGESWDGSDTYRTSDYTLYDAMVGYEFDRVSLLLNVRNLEDKIYVTSTENGTGFYGNRRAAIISAKYRF